MLDAKSTVVAVEGQHHLVGRDQGQTAMRRQMHSGPFRNTEGVHDGTLRNAFAGSGQLLEESDGYEPLRYDPTKWCIGSG
jgi:hypothetical protein